MIRVTRVIGPREACSETYVVAGRFNNRVEAENFAAYMRTRFARYLVSLRKVTQDAAKDVYAFVPDVPLDREWSEARLYARYGLSRAEIDIIEAVVRPVREDVNEVVAESDDE